MRKNKVLKICEHCNEEYFTTHVKGRFCSKKCADNHRRKYKNCIICNKQFYPKDKRKLTCSEECYHKLKNKDKIEKECEICGKKFHIPKCREKAKFCSPECYHKSRKTGRRTKSNCVCDYCGNEFYKAKSLQEKHQHNFCSVKCMGKYYSENKLFSGENSGTWNGGKKTYYGENWLSQRRKARKRDNYTCQRCGITEKEYGQELSVHHKIPFIMFKDYKEANRLDNLICVCEPCHRKIHSGENHPSKFFDTYKNFIEEDE